ncbi:MAG: purine-binding chemotaxis protein CheW [SAR324 cluster bacterium]|nr:purine-binding chemotaxis protein CheW [SAR324 cluster bacterium]
MSATEIRETIQFLTFQLQQEVFAVEIAKVREVLELASITKVPRTPAFMRGVINLRGNVVPVIDMNLKFDMLRTDQTVNTCIIIVEIRLDGEETLLGALVDSVQEVMDLHPDQIEPPPKIGAKLKAEFIRGMGKHDDRFLIILDIDKIFSSDELNRMQKVSRSGSSVREKTLQQDESVEV